MILNRFRHIQLIAIIALLSHNCFAGLRSGDLFLRYDKNKEEWILDDVVGFTPDGQLVARYGKLDFSNMILVGSLGQLLEERRKTNSRCPSWSFSEVQYSKGNLYPRHIVVLKDKTREFPHSHSETWDVYLSYYLIENARYGFRVGDDALYKDEVQVIKGFHYDGSVRLSDYPSVSHTELSPILKEDPDDL